MVAGPTSRQVFSLVLAALPRQITATIKNCPGTRMHKASTKVSIFVIVISMIASSAWADPLAAGKPAGVHGSREQRHRMGVFGGIGALAAGI